MNFVDINFISILVVTHYCFQYLFFGACFYLVWDVGWDRMETLFFSLRTFWPAPGLLARLILAGSLLHS